jgi:ribosomal protein L28
VEEHVKYLERRLKISTTAAERLHRYLSLNWQTDQRVADMAKKVKVSETTLRSIANKLKLGARLRQESSPSDPSPEEIKSRAEAVQALWTPAERKRREYGRIRWIAPTIPTGEIEPPTFSRNPWR